MESSNVVADENENTEHESRPTFYIGHHDGMRTEVGSQLLQQAQDSGVSISVKPISFRKT